MKKYIWFALTYAAMVSLVLYAGGKPNPGTKRDMRLKENKSKAVPPVKKGGK